MSQSLHSCERKSSLHEDRARPAYTRHRASRTPTQIRAHAFGAIDDESAPRRLRSSRLDASLSLLFETHTHARTHEWMRVSAGLPRRVAFVELARRSRRGDSAFNVFLESNPLSAGIFGIERRL